MIAATAPCSARAAISAFGEGASEHSTDADHESADADQQHPAATEQIAQPAAEQQRHRHRQRVGGGDPLECGVGAAEVATDRGRGGLRDRRVQQVHHRGGEDNEEAEPGGPAGVG